MGGYCTFRLNCKKCQFFGHALSCQNGKNGAVMERGVLTPRIKGKRRERKGGETRKWGDESKSRGRRDLRDRATRVLAACPSPFCSQFFFWSAKKEGSALRPHDNYHEGGRIFGTFETAGEENKGRIGGWDLRGSSGISNFPSALQCVPLGCLAQFGKVGWNGFPILSRTFSLSFADA